MITKTVINQIVISADDFRRLKAVIREARYTRRRTYVNALERELRWADVRPHSHVPGDAVTMNSKVRLRDVDSGLRRVVSLAYPHHINDREALSVLTPLGTALLGVRAGKVVSAPTPDGIRSVEIERVLYQPEAAGDLHL